MADCVLMDGKALSQKIRNQIKVEVESIKNNNVGIVPGLAVVLVGNDPASEIYVRNKEKACAEVGFTSKKIVLEDTVSEEELLSVIDNLNNDNSIHGILVQLPLPAHINKDRVIDSIATEKDVDIFKTDSMGKLFEGVHCIAPCTPSGIMALLDEYNIDLEGKHCVIVGRSNIVGKPIAMMLMQRNATVTICHSKTKNLKDFCKMADVIICAVGKTNLITDDMVKEGVVIVDVGINRNEQGKVCGDVNIENKDLVSYMTPVPGGVGPMTITMLLKNTLELFKNSL